MSAIHLRVSLHYTKQTQTLVINQSFEDLFFGKNLKQPTSPGQLTPAFNPAKSLNNTEWFAL